MGGYEQVKTAIELAISHTADALTLVKESAPIPTDAPKGLLASVRATLTELNSPRQALIVTLTNSIHELKIARDANERLRDIA